MALVPAAAGGGAVALVSHLIRTGSTVIVSKIGAIGIAIGSLIADVVNLDMLRQESIKVAPGSEPAAIEWAARTAARLLNLSGNEVLWPVHGNTHAKAGQFIIPHYMTIDLVRGRAWYSTTHFSMKSVRAARRGAGRGFRRRAGAYGHMRGPVINNNS